MASWINPVESERPKRPFAPPVRGVAESMTSMGTKEARLATVWLQLVRCVHWTTQFVVQTPLHAPIFKVTTWTCPD